MDYAKSNQIINIAASQRKNLDNACSSACCADPCGAAKEMEQDVLVKQHAPGGVI